MGSLVEETLLRPRPVIFAAAWAVSVCKLEITPNLLERGKGGRNAQDHLFYLYRSTHFWFRLFKNDYYRQRRCGGLPVKN